MMMSVVLILVACGDAPAADTAPDNQEATSEALAATLEVIRDDARKDAAKPRPTRRPTGQENVDSANLNPWPFTVQSGTLICINDGVTFTAPDGAVYAINGTALTEGKWRDIRESDIWADNPDAPGSKIDISEVIERGLALCP